MRRNAGTDQGTTVAPATVAAGIPEGFPARKARKGRSEGAEATDPAKPASPTLDAPLAPPIDCFRMSLRSETRTPSLGAGVAAPIPHQAETATSAQEEPASSTPFLCRPRVRLALYAFLALTFLAMLAWRFVPVLMDPTFEKHIQAKKVVVGMTREQVLQAWGGPYTINVSYTKDGLRREEWIYEDWASPSDVTHRYLYFEEGVLIAGWYK